MLSRNKIFLLRTNMLDFQFKMAEQDMCSYPPAKAPKLQLVVEQPLTGGRWNPPKKDSPHPKTKKKPQ